MGKLKDFGEKAKKGMKKETKKIEIQIVSDLEEATIEGQIMAYAENVSRYLRCPSA